MATVRLLPNYGQVNETDLEEYLLPGYGIFNGTISTGSNIKTIDDLAKASIGSIDGVAIGDVKDWGGLQ